VEAARACHDVAIAYGTPFISGKDSLNNEFRAGDRSIVIPHSLLISAISIVEDVRRCTTMDAKEAGNPVYLAGETREELGGSHFALVNGAAGGRVPRVEAASGARILRAMAAAIRTGAVRACHDLSEGGLAVAAAESAFAGGLGLSLELPDAGLDDAVALFSESPSRFLVEVEAGREGEAEAAFAGLPFRRLGRVTAEGRLTIRGRAGGVVVDEPIAALKEAWQKPLRW
jgi:phosphoribosylformylglycinamidine (FGAM) synthase-like enzyme